MEQIINEELVLCIISNPRQKGGATKINVRPLSLRGETVYQFASYTAKQVAHENVGKEKAVERLGQEMQQFKQLEALGSGFKTMILVSKKGRFTVKRKKTDGPIDKPDLSHNRKKKYVLDPEVCVPFLQDLGVQTATGKIVHSHYDKFKQINRFLEFIEDIADQLPTDREAVIIDFGCGKSYLTFAMYYYLHELKGLNIKIIGLDLKQDVIEHCNGLRTSYGYDKLDFYVGDIADYKGVNQVDMVVTLHACDTATDYALDKAIRWHSKVILSVPCCQHELNHQIHSDELQPILKYGLLKERMSALITDGVRANILEEAGYDVQLLEFIDLEHTPKNILIRGVKRPTKGPLDEKASQARKKFEEMINGELTLSRLQKEG